MGGVLVIVLTVVVAALYPRFLAYDSREPHP
jgi:hypothetical protein